MELTQSVIENMTDEELREISEYYSTDPVDITKNNRRFKLIHIPRDYALDLMLGNLRVSGLPEGINKIDAVEYDFPSDSFVLRLFNSNFDIVPMGMMPESYVGWSLNVVLKRRAHEHD